MIKIFSKLFINNSIGKISFYALTFAFVFLFHKAFIYSTITTVFVLVIVRFYQIQNSLELVKNGQLLSARIVEIKPSDLTLSSFREGEEIPIEYTFEIDVKHRKLTYSFCSIEHKHLKLFSEHWVFVNQNDLNNYFIPVQFHIDQTEIIKMLSKKS